GQTQSVLVRRPRGRAGVRCARAGVRTERCPARRPRLPRRHRVRAANRPGSRGRGRRRGGRLVGPIGRRLVARNGRRVTAVRRGRDALRIGLRGEGRFRQREGIAEDERDHSRAVRRRGARVGDGSRPDAVTRQRRRRVAHARRGRGRGAAARRARRSAVAAAFYPRL
ncbi:MAG: hypothetical protein AVDCRST_MAG67-386, partial [uncultured Solirubrobacteraceae bacterium]